MSQLQTWEQVVSLARQQEKSYDWMKAAEYYTLGIETVPTSDPVKTGDLSEASGYAFYKASLQADTSDQFRNRIQSAISHYEAAEEIFRKLNGQQLARELRCKAWLHYLNFWTATELRARRQLLRDAWRSLRDCLHAFEENDDGTEYGSTYNKLAICGGLIWLYESDLQALEKTNREAVDWGRKATQHLSKLHDSEGLARAYVNTASFLFTVQRFIQRLDEQEDHSKEARGYWDTAKQLSQEAAILGLSFNSYDFTGGEGSEDTLRMWQRSLELHKKTRDKLSTASVLTHLVYNNAWKAVGTEEPDDKARHTEEALRSARECKQLSQIILLPSPVSPIMWPESPEAEYYLLMGLWESDLERKRAQWQNALKSAPQMVNCAQDAGYPIALLLSHHVFSKALSSAAKLEKNTKTKEEMLTKALEERNLCRALSQQVEPFHYFNQAVYQHYLAEITYQLSNLATDSVRKKSPLSDAIRDKAAGIALLRKIQSQSDEGLATPQLTWLGDRIYEQGNMLVQLSELEQDPTPANEALDAFTEAAEIFGKAENSSRRAECYWKMARTQDVLEYHVKASESFLLASKLYNASAEKLPQLTQFYKDLALYLESWSFIEKARHHHAREEYGQAEGFYSKAADLHRSTREWAALATNYSAWARLERAESLSRNDESKTATTAFQEAAELFMESRKIIGTKTPTAWSDEEKLFVSKLASAADLRRDYCSARAMLEEARELDKKGEHYLCAEKCASAAASFQEILDKLESKRSEKEVKLILTLSKAWEQMARAEAEVSPTLYPEASRLFEEAKELGSSEKARMLALGHSRFCQALEAGARFADTADEAFHSTAIQQLESASKYYVRAGFQNASDYAEASKLLFDAYSYMNRAARENAQEEKARLFVIAEKTLASSADTFARAGQSAKKDQVSQILEKVRKSKELAVSLTDVFKASPVVSTSTAFGTPTPTYEKAVGLDRFEHADVHASMIAQKRNMRVGETFEVEIELVNAGKGAAQLVKVEDVIPHGFELTQRPESYRLEDSFLNMKGKTLAPLKTEEVRLTLMPKVQGRFTLKPRILYLDEGGKYKSHEPEPVEVTVKELGITGWVKGPK